MRMATMLRWDGTYQQGLCINRGLSRKTSRGEGLDAKHFGSFDGLKSTFNVSEKDVQNDMYHFPWDINIEKALYLNLYVSLR